MMECIMTRENQVVGFKQHDDGTMTFTLAGRSRTTNPTAYSEQVQTEAFRLGIKTRLSNKAAIAHDAKTGRAATPEEKRVAIWALIDHYETGTDSWEMPR